MTASLPSVPTHPVGTVASTTVSRRILIWDDDLEFAEELAFGLSLGRHDVRTLVGAPSPFAVFESFVPQIVLLDIHMPPPDGFEVLEFLQHNPRREDVSLIMMSGSGMTYLNMAASLCAARQIKLVGMLQKPLKIADIVSLCDLAATGQAQLTGQPS